jgi:ABC-type transport system substrate-binding protein
MDLAFNTHIPEQSLFIGSGRLDGDGIPPDFFADLSIRKAFASCFDYDTFLRDVAMGEAVRRNGPIIAGMVGHDPNDPPAPEFDLAACEERFRLADLDHDGIPAGDDDDDVWSTGFYVALGYLSGAEPTAVALQLLEENIEAINEEFDIDLITLAWPVYLKQHEAGALPLEGLGWAEDYHHPHNWVYPYLSSGAGLGNAVLPQDVQNELDAMIARAKDVTDPAQQHEAYKAIQRRAAELQPYIWLTQPSLRHWEPLWMEGWFYNPAHPCDFVYGMSESQDSPHPRAYVSGVIIDAKTLDPADAYDVWSMCWVGRLYDPLVYFEREATDEFVGQLSDRWQVSEDGLTYTFHIRDGVRFHAGGELDAHDAAYAIWRGMLRDASGGPQWMFWDAMFGYDSAASYALAKANEALKP